MVELIIAALMALGLLNSSQEWNTLSQDRQAEMTEIVIHDVIVD